jgi:integrase/recombinase XerD
MTLFEGARCYIERKRKAGLIYDKPAGILSAFCGKIGDMPLGHINPRQVLAFLDGPRTSTVTWRLKYNLLKSFFEYWAARGGVQTLPMPPIRPPCRQTFVPYVYSRTELRLLLRSTQFSQRRDACMIDSRTLRTLLVFLYGTGVLTGEALRLTKGDVDLKNDVVTIRNKRFGRVRHIPIGPDLHRGIRRYFEWTARREIQCPNVFANRDGSTIKTRILGTSFERLRRVAGIARHDGARYQPRMHDLRHTFAVHRLTAWFKQGADLNRMLPALAAYMGQVGLGSTERYLSMTPERFRTQLVMLSPERRKRRWRDNASLMKFLAEL